LSVHDPRLGSVLLAEAKAFDRKGPKYPQRAREEEAESKIRTQLDFLAVAKAQTRPLI
jgi:hypothetical protein